MDKMDMHGYTGIHTRHEYTRVHENIFVHERIYTNIKSITRIYTNTREQSASEYAKK